MPVAPATMADWLFLVLNHRGLLVQDSGHLPPDNLVYFFFCYMIAEPPQPLREFLFVRHANPYLHRPLGL